MRMIYSEAPEALAALIRRGANACITYATSPIPNETRMRVRAFLGAVTRGPGWPNVHLRHQDWPKSVDTKNCLQALVFNSR